AGKYAAAKSKLQQLNKDFADAEQGKTFGKSDLDEAYYYRQLAEYDRDKAEEDARAKLEETDRQNGRQKADQMLADPPPLAPQPGVTAEMLHWREERGRNRKRAAKTDKLRGSLPGRVKEEWEKARALERKVVDKVRGEVSHQERVDRAAADMSRIDGPADPAA